MVETVLTYLSWPLIAAGAFFFLVGSVGLLRMPDIFTRMHATSVTDTLGAGLLLIGMMLEAGLTLVTVKLLIILAIILFTSPVATHALAQAALHDDVVPVLKSKKVEGVPVGDAAIQLDFETKPRTKSSTKKRASNKSRAKRKGSTSSKPS